MTQELDISVVDRIAPVSGVGRKSCAQRGLLVATEGANRGDLLVIGPSHRHVAVRHGLLVTGIRIGDRDRACGAQQRRCAVFSDCASAGDTDDRTIVLACEGDADLLIDRATIVVLDRDGVNLGQGFPFGQEIQISVVDRVGPIHTGRTLVQWVQDKRAKRAGQQLILLVIHSGVDAGRVGVGHVHVRKIHGAHRSQVGDVFASGEIGDFGDGAHVLGCSRHDGGCIVGSGHGHVNLTVDGAAVLVIERDRKALRHALAYGQVFRCRS